MSQAKPTRETLPQDAIEARQERGKEIAKNFGQVRRINDCTYRVQSQTTPSREYKILHTPMGWSCQCRDQQRRGIGCKHIWAVRFSFDFRKVVLQDGIVIRPISVHACPSCQSTKVVRNGKRPNKARKIQRFICRSCHHRFVVNLGFERMHATPKTITLAMQLYYSGASFRAIRNTLLLKGIKVSHVSIQKWLKKYVALMEDYLAKYQPQVGDTWRTDEMWVAIKGDKRLLFSIMDDETRFCIAQQVAVHKGSSDVRPMFKRSKERAGKRPAILITDGAKNFHQAWKKEFNNNRTPRPVHIEDVRFDGTVHNNKMERMNGEFRDREKTMRGVKKKDSPALMGLALYHNFIRPHMALGGATPAEKAGITVEGQNKWITLIQNAARDSLGYRDPAESSGPESRPSG